MLMALWIFFGPTGVVYLLQELRIQIHQQRRQ
jgi:hypothetical protein